MATLARGDVGAEYLSHCTAGGWMAIMTILLKHKSSDKQTLKVYMSPGVTSTVYFH